MAPQTSWFCPRTQKQFWEKQAPGPKPSQGPRGAPAQSCGGEGRRRDQLSCAHGTQHHLSPCNAQLEVGGERAQKQHERPRLAPGVNNLRCVQPRAGRGRGEVAPDSARAEGQRSRADPMHSSQRKQKHNQVQGTNTGRRTQEVTPTGQRSPEAPAQDAAQEPPGTDAGGRRE